MKKKLTAFTLISFCVIFIMSLGVSAVQPYDTYTYSVDGNMLLGPTSEDIEDKNDKAMPLTMRNYVLLLIGAVIIVIGFVLMSGGGNHTATEFDESIFSFRRITLAPIVVIAGFVIEIFAIMKRFSNDNNDK